MNKTVLFAGVDVDDKAFHVCVLNSTTEESFEFSVKPEAAALIRKLHELRRDGDQIRICYEATYVGFSLYRALKGKGFDCAVIAPSHIPTVPGVKKKTDRLDSVRLAKYFRSGLLTIVSVPDEISEKHRALIRSRRFLVAQLTRTKRHIDSMCRTLGWHYRQESTAKKLWTKAHRVWLASRIRYEAGDDLETSMKILVNQLHQLENNIGQYDEAIAKLSRLEKYRRKVDALVCYRGLDTQSAMTLITEIHDIKRFSHPTKLGAYAGLDVKEYSSGGREKKFGITKSGNRFLRTTVVEACQYALKPVQISRPLKARRKGISSDYCVIADRCMGRLHKKGTRLLFSGKPRNKVITACAREMLNFVWESLTRADSDLTKAA